MQIRLLTVVFLFTNAIATAQTLGGHPFVPPYQSAVTASGFWSYRPPTRNFIALGRGAHRDEPCSDQNVYPLGGLSFEMTCPHWDALNSRRWRTGDVRDIHEAFKEEFHSQ
ncbi:hypothetical protein [Paraburkholderia sp. J12]|uniref:hypothetical protein n=1 Tax=Paraburkholderia sp. J12 TaxID=2805432 RepID=UPI002ABD670B|nr:hypothetical protein [Paraburkholderia sp. J12]